MPFSAIIVDDEPLAIEALNRFCQRSGQVVVVGEATDGATGLKLAASVRPDAMFLDIGMPGLSGLDVAALLSAAACRPLIVFVTAFDHFATQAFDLSVVDYVLKPLVPARLDRAVERLTTLLLDRQCNVEPADEFWVPNRGGMSRIPAASIRRVDAERDYVRLGVSDRSYLLREPISAIEERLDPSAFVRIHRSTILRNDTVTGLRHLGAGAWAAVDATGRENRIGRSYLARVRDRLGI